MIKISKNEARLIRKINKQKGRLENTSLVSAGAGRSALPEYIVWNTQDRSTSKMFNMWRTESNKLIKNELKDKIVKALTNNLENAKDDIFKLEALIDAYENIYRFEDAEEVLLSLKAKIQERQNVLVQAEKYYNMTLKNLNKS